MGRPLDQSGRGEYDQRPHAAGSVGERDDHALLFPAAVRAETTEQLHPPLGIRRQALGTSTPGRRLRRDRHAPQPAIGPHRCGYDRRDLGGRIAHNHKRRTVGQPPRRVRQAESNTLDRPGKPRRRAIHSYHLPPTHEQDEPVVGHRGPLTGAHSVIVLARCGQSAESYYCPRI